MDLAKDNSIQFLQLVVHIAFTAANGLTGSVDRSKKQLDDVIIKLLHLAVPTGLNPRFMNASIGTSAACRHIRDHK